MAIRRPAPPPRPGRVVGPSAADALASADGMPDVAEASNGPSSADADGGRSVRSAAGCRGLVVLFSHRYPDHMDVQVDVAEVEVHLSELLARIEAGEEITLTRAGRPVATLRPLEPPVRRVFGGRPDLKIPDEFFFEPLADEELALWE